MKKCLQHIAWGIPLAAFLWIFFRGLNAHYPLLGHDYAYFLPRLLDGRWHFMRQGFSPFYFTPHFCGGVPQFGNPQDMFYSLPQFLSLLLDPWLAAQFSMFFVLLAGYAGWYLFGRDALRLSCAAAHVLALVIIANGFYFMHMLVGHLAMHSIPLIGIQLWLIYDRRDNTGASLAWRTGFFAMLTAYMLYSGGVFVLMISATFLLCLLPMDVLLKHTAVLRHARTLVMRLTLFTMASLLICASKLIATYSYMRFFPRHVPFDQMPEASNAVLYILRAFWGMPQGLFLFANAGRGLHEYSMFVSPLVLIGMLLGLAWCAKQYRHKRPSLRTLTVLFFGLCLLFFFIQLAQGGGWMMVSLKALPLFSSIRITFRFIYIVAVLFSIIGIAALAQWVSARMTRYWNTLIMAGGMITIIGFIIAYAPVVMLGTEEYGMTFLYDGLPLFPEKERAYLEKEVTHVIDWGARGVPEMQHLYDGSTSIHCYESLFLGNTQQFASLSEGSVSQELNGFFNIHNPACLQYPEANNCTPGQNIAVNDRANLEAFRKGERTTWKIPLYQRVSNWISLLTFIGCLGMICVGGRNSIRLV